MEIAFGEVNQKDKEIIGVMFLKVRRQ